MTEIQQAIDDAVAEENYELAGELTNKYLKGEAKKVWENELNRINENLHIRIKWNYLDITNLRIYNL